MTRSRRNLAVGVVLATGLVLGVVLVVAGGSGDEAPDPARQPTTSSSIVPSAAATEPLPLDDLTQTGVEQLAELDLPPGATDFLTARLADGAQLDVTFTMPPGEEAAFLEASGLPELVEEQRVILHSSPLWKLNPDDAAVIRGAADRTERVARAVELVDEGERVRARVVITSTD